MTRQRRSLADLEHDLETLEDVADGSREGFHYFKIGGDPDADVGGYYTWNSERGVYVNDEGHELPPSARSDSGFEFTLTGDNRS